MSDITAERNRWNTCRYRAAAPGGHYESFFQRANHPTRPLAFWIRYTIFRPADQPHGALGELWAIWFDGEKEQIVAVKHEEPLANCRFDETKLGAQIGGATLHDGALDGRAALGGHEIAWQLDFSGGGRPLLLLPERLYSGGFPKAKALVGWPNCVYRGTIGVDGQSHAIDGWPGSQNHNWGSKHTDHYAWGQVCGFDDAPETFLEVSTARIKLGPVWTPFMTLVVLRAGAQQYALNTIQQALKAKGRFDYFDWNFRSATPDVTISGRIHAPASSFCGLNYYNPPGGSKTCLNSKIAACEVTLVRRGETPLTLRSANRAAFEILTDDASHGVAVRA